MRAQTHKTTGSVLLWTILTIAVLSILAAEVLRVVSTKYQNALQTSIWQESLLAAESGVDLAIVELRKSLFPAPNHAWEGWNNAPNNGATSYALTAVPNAGLAGTPMTIEVNVDGPPQLLSTDNNWQYYRIRATGTMPLTGPVRANDNKQDTQLRRLSLRFERFANGILASHSIATPQAARRVEAVVKPVSSFDQAIMSVGTLDLTNQNIEIDSYDSRSSAKSTNGLYDAAKRQEHGNIATDGQILDAGSAHVYGDVATNSGVASNIANITGIERTDFYQEPIPIAAPTWGLFNATPTSVTSNATLTASATSGSAASRYQLSTIDISGNKTLTLAGNPDGSTTYIEVYVTGDVSVKGSGQIVLQPGVSAKIYFAGNVDVQGNGIINTNNQPLDLQLYGIQPADDVSRHVGLGGNAKISAALYAPGFDVTIDGAGNAGHIYGSMVGKTVTMNGVSNLHYDEALGAGGLINNYKIVSWFEDNR